MEVPGLGVESEMQLLAYATATAMHDPSHVCKLHIPQFKAMLDLWHTDWGQGSNPLPHRYWRLKDVTGIQVLVHALKEWTPKTHRQQASKVFIIGTQIAPRAPGSGEKSPRSLLSYRGFYPLKTGGGYQHGVQKDVVFSYWPCPVTYISLCPVGFLGVEISCKVYGFIVLLVS